MNSSMKWVFVAVCACACTPEAQAQNVAQQVKSTRDGTVNMLFASQPGVCGDGETFISTGETDDDGNHATYRQTRGGLNTTYGYSDYRRRPCNEGPVRVALHVTNGEVDDIDTYVGGHYPENAITVSAKSAVDYLLSLAESSSSTVGKHAIFPTIIADSVEPWPQLLHIAKNESVAREVRKNAVFWLGQAAGDKTTAGLKSLLSDDDTEIRKQAVFALSQLRGDQSVGALIDVVKTNKDPQVRKTALFWLAQKNDPRVLALLEDILIKN